MGKKENREVVNSPIIAVIAQIRNYGGSNEDGK